MLVLIIGPSGSGKTSVIRKLGYPELLSTTSRAIRDGQGELDGVDYRFISRSEFTTKLAAGEFVEHTEYIGNLYGFLKIDVSKCTDLKMVYIAAVDYKGVIAMREYLGAQNVFAISIRASEENLRAWMKQRGDAQVDIDSRIEGMINNDEILTNEKLADICVVNEGLDKLTNTISKSIIEKLRKLKYGSVKSQASSK